MSFQLTKQVIKMLCGRLSYERGEAYQSAGRVRFTAIHSNRSFYEADVRGRKLYQVTVDIGDGGVHALCTCPILESYDNYCKHIAAVLLEIHDLEHGSSPPARSYASALFPEDRQDQSGRMTERYAGREAGRDRAALDKRLTDSVLNLFSDKPQLPTGMRPLFETREPLLAEFICRPFPYAYRKYMLGIEMKVGPKRLYIVQRIREFLQAVDRGQSYEFSRHFTYDPERHSFPAEYDAVLRQLLDIHQHEQLYRETAGTYSGSAKSVSGDRLLLVPPSVWPALHQALSRIPTVQFEHDGIMYQGIEISHDPLPLHFDFDQSDKDDYRMNVEGLNDMLIMEAYGLVVHQGKLTFVQPEYVRRLAELKQMLETRSRHHIRIAPEQMEAFMDKVVPRLMKLGNVHIAQSVTEQVVHEPLKAKLYLDRVRGKLLAGLEFRYGEVVINPLETDSRRQNPGRILMRDSEQERRILELMDSSSFATTESGYVMENEDAEFDFLYHTVPQLELLMEIYATSAVKTRLVPKPAAPKVRIDVDERTNWLEFKFDMDGIPESEIRGVLQSLEEKRRYYRLPNGALLPLEGEELQEMVRFMNEVGIRRGDLEGTDIRIPLLQGLHLMEQHDSMGKVKLGSTLQRLLDHIRNPDKLEFPVPDSLASVLRDYQCFGYRWLKTLAHYRFGGILADDMGLGKTLQSITFIVSVLPEIRQEQLPALIVAPASLVYNWANELKKFAPDIRAVIADGSRTARSSLIRDAYRADVIITSYPLLRMDVDLYAEQPFHSLILDEAQSFKNHSTQTAHAVKAVQARHRFALTGTPVENHLEELWSIYNAVFPELFQSRKEFNDLTREQVAQRVRPFLLRRLKTDVLKELPEKIETVQTSSLLADQKKLYTAYLARLQQETLKHLNEEGFQKSRIKILAGLTRLRQICCHPALFVEGYQGRSAKFEQLLDILEECRNAGKRALIFSQFTQMLGLIGRELGYQGVSHFYLDGQTPAAERVELCNRFNVGERDLFLISLKAGGTGLNLTGADTVILYDLWWNPAVEQQAADRAHRMGQKNIVQVIRLVTQGTVEDKMYELQQKKKNLIEEVIRPGQEELSSMSEEEIREILMI
ncbi:SNF2 helicase associated domain-containing protein [Paenibacillus sp. P96]|uniref:SNF2 helicase associated domain-containing protein n=1 Tax=Paenibacillus zeirhizosphaerae TaxID=2987519 RepID=A0ABT9FMR5_9BACL|nr:DEAD/DEAH box helicase [Paenibacillus sp. P96]MDP4095900.1 SNF2 helicase associated domain-containing protein [Paenibacillus sp. P96]